MRSNGMLAFIVFVVVFMCGCVSLIFLPALLQFPRDDELVTDFSLTYSRIGFEDDHETDLNINGIWSNEGISVTELDEFGNETTGSSRVESLGARIGNFDSYDQGVQIGVSRESMTVTDANSDVILQTSERESGFADNEEVSNIFLGVDNQVGYIRESELILRDKETEDIYRGKDGVAQKIATVTEFGSNLGREGLRHGTRIDDYQHEFVYETAYDTWTGWLKPNMAGSRVVVNGEYVMHINARHGGSPWILPWWDQFSLEDPDSGHVYCTVDYDNAFTKASTKTTFRCGDEWVADIFLETNLGDVDITPKGNRCWEPCSRTIWNISWNVAGDTTEEKMLSLRTVDFIMTLMMDQVNKNPFQLHELEELTDVLMIALEQPNNEDRAAVLGVGLNQEEDGLTVREAYEYITFTYGPRG